MLAYLNPSRALSPLNILLAFSLRTPGSPTLPSRPSLPCVPFLPEMGF